MRGLFDHHGLSSAFVLLGLVVSGCSLIDLDGLENGAGGGAASATSATSTTATGVSSASVGTGGAAPGPYETAVLADSPLAYFRFEDSTAATCSNQLQGSGIACSYPDHGFSQGAKGTVGSGICFDSKDALLQFSGPLDFPGDVPFTMELWIDVSSSMSGQGGEIFSDMMDPGEMRTGTWLLLGNDDVPFSETWINGNHYLYTHGTMPISFGKWVQVVLTHSDVDHLYIDTQPTDGGVVNGGYQRVTNGVPLSIGGLVGCVDELSIYDHALGTDRIAVHFAAGSTP